MVSMILTLAAFLPVSAQDIVDKATAESAQQTLENTKLTERQAQLKEKISEMALSEAISSANDRRKSGNDSVESTLRVSLLTCGQGDEAYELYGHSAIRILCTDSVGFDIVFNYGIFDFNSDNFILRFSLGETDYICGMQDTEDFIESYRRAGRYIDEQVLNMTQREAERLYNALIENSKPENRVYRYNFFHDNCATRVRDIIESCLDGKLQYPERPLERSWRDALHFFNRGSKWYAFGQDLVLGAEADVLASGRELEFVPLIMEQDFSGALITDQLYQIHTFASEKTRLLDLPAVVPEAGFFLSPLAVAILLLVIAIVLGFVEFKRGRIVWIFDSIAMLTQGIAGLIVTFMFFFSVHPTVGSNWLVWILNPLPLIGLFWQIRGARRHRYACYHKVAAVVIGLFLICSPFISQKFGAAILILALFLFVRNITNLIVWRKIKAGQREIKK